MARKRPSGLSLLFPKAGLDGFLAIEKYVLHQKGLFTTDRRREPNSWSLDEETRLEVDRLLVKLAAAIAG